MPTKSLVRRSLPALLGGLAALLFCGPARAQVETLVTGKKITLPAPGTQANVGSMPMNVILTPDGKYAITTDMGFRESLHVISTATGKDAAPPLPFGKANSEGSYGPLGLYYGLAAKANGDGSSTVYASEGANGGIAVVRVAAAGAMTLLQTFGLRERDFPAGLALDGRGYLYAVSSENHGVGGVTNVVSPGALLVLDAATGFEIGRCPLGDTVGTLSLPTGQQPWTTTSYPLCAAALKDGSKVYVSSQRDGVVYVLDTRTPTSPKLMKAIPTGQHPISLLLDKSQQRLFVANADSDTVSVVRTDRDTVAHTVLLQPTAARGLPGMTPTGLGLPPDESRLYVSLGDFNAVGVVNAATYDLMGYVPAGWYPTGVVVSPANDHLLVMNAKGSQTRYPNPANKPRNPSQYVLNLIEGSVQTLPVPSPSDLAGDTQMALDNSRLAEITQPNPLAAIGLRAGKIKHVFYVIKENRTYDQLLGDEAGGNGDPTLAIFGRDVTPNQHALAERFVLLDNFYDCGEVSGDGWPWSTQGQADEYVIKNLPYNYSGRGRGYDFEGSNDDYPTGGFPAKDPYGQPLAPASPFHDPRRGGRAPAVRDVAEAPGGHVWDDVLKNVNLRGTDLTHALRSYGVFTTFGDSISLPDNYPSVAGLQPAGHDNGGITDIDFRRFDVDYADSDAPQQVGSPYPLAAYGHSHAPSRFSEWNREFQEALAADPTGNGVAAFQILRFMHDHTQGLSAGKHTPRAEVADNDYAVGQLVEALSNSPIWDSTAVFILEDDAQDGPDHVDAHRSVCFVVSPYVKQNSVDHTFYNTDSVLHTMELLLGLPPMNQYDAIASPIADFDTAPSNAAPYAPILPAPAILSELGPVSPKSALRPLETLTAKMDFVHPDSAPSGPLNQVLWKSVMGMASPMPAPRHVPIPLPHKASAPKDRDGQ